MPFSYKKYIVTDSTQTVYDIGFDKLSTDHITISKNGTNLTLTTHYSFSSSTQVTFTSDAGLTVNDVILISRSTPKTTTNFQTDVADFSDAQVLTASDLDQATLGLLYIAQEAEDNGNTNSISLNAVSSVWDASSSVDGSSTNLRITNVGFPTSDTDAVTKAYVDQFQQFGSSSQTPQAWSYTGGSSNVTIGSSNTTITLDPAPLSSDAVMFIIEVGGVLQDPTNDYTVTLVGANHIVTLTGHSSTAGNIESTTTIRIRNFGIARNVFTNVDDSGQIGIGTANPQELLHIMEGDSSATASDDADTLFIENNGNAGLTIGSGTTNTGGVMFSKGGTTDAGGVIYTHASDTTENLAFRVSGSTRATISNTGKLGIGVTSPAREIDILGSGSASMQINDGTRNIYMGTDSDNPFIGSSTAHDLRIITNSTEKMRVASDGDIGIGTTTPAAKLHVSSASSGVSPNTGGDELFIDGSGDSGITIGSGNDDAGAIYFADADSNSSGQLSYSHNTNHLNITTNGNLNFVVTDDGIVQANNSTGRFLVNNGGTASVPTFSFVGDSNTGMFQNGSDVLAFACGGSTTLSLSGTVINANTHKIENLVDPTSNQDAATKKYVDQTGGILSDLTPTISSSDATITLDSSFNTLSYYRIGKMVTIMGHLKVSSGYASSSSSGTVTITNLPYTCKTGNQYDVAVEQLLKVSSGSFDSMGVRIQDGTKIMSFDVNRSNNTFTSSGHSNWRTGNELYFQISYVTDETE